MGSYCGESAGHKQVVAADKDHIWRCVFLLSLTLYLSHLHCEMGHPVATKVE